MRGISFIIDNEYDNALEKIFNEIEIEKYNWDIPQKQAYNRSNQNLFEENNIDGDNFSNIIKHQEYYLVFLYLKAYLKVCPEIHNYDEFLKSDCEIVLLISDSIFVDIYCKDIKNIEKIRLNALKNNFTKIEYITDENDGRSGFGAY